MSKPAVPYCTVKGFRKCMQLLGTPPTPSRVDRQVLVDRGLSPHAAYPVLGALRFLGIITEDGSVTERLEAFLEDDPVRRHAIVADAYGDILADVKFPIEEREEVDRILVEKHDCAPGVAAFCSTLFLWLAAEAGMPVAIVGRQRRGRPPAHLSQLSPSARSILLERGASLSSARQRPDGGGLDEAFGGAERSARPALRAPGRRSDEATRS